MSVLGHLIYSTVTIISNTVLYIYKLWREQILNVITTKKIIIWGDEYVDGFIKLTYCGIFTIYIVSIHHIVHLNFTYVIAEFISVKPGKREIMLKTEEICVEFVIIYFSIDWLIVANSSISLRSE